MRWWLALAFIGGCSDEVCDFDAVLADFAPDETIADCGEVALDSSTASHERVNACVVAHERAHEGFLMRSVERGIDASRYFALVGVARASGAYEMAYFEGGTNYTGGRRDRMMQYACTLVDATATYDPHPICDDRPIRTCQE